MITTRLLTKQFADTPAIQNVNLEVQPGTIYGFLGTNGAGKTTTIKILMGLLVPTSGSATIAGLDTRKDRLVLKSKVGYLPDTPLFPSFLKGREILEMAGELHGFSRAEARRRAEQLLEWLGLVDAAEEYSEQYSIGMKKRLGLGCATVHDPDVYLLDEPTNGLDPYATRLVSEWIQSQSQTGRTILLSTHRLDMAERVCTHLGIIHKGRMITQGELGAIRGRMQAEDLEEIFFAVTQGEVMQDA
jgi:ABC-2 type transport system ATP-binding protein